MAIGVRDRDGDPGAGRGSAPRNRRELVAPAIAAMRWRDRRSEPGARFRCRLIKTNARSDGDDDVINGGKMWTTNGVKVDWICLLPTAATDRFIARNRYLRADEGKGVEVARKLDKMGTG